MVNEISTTQVNEGTNQDMASARLKTICAEFESIFMTYMMKSMRSAMVEEGIMGSSHESKIMNAMFDENLALEVANGGGIGLGNVLFERLNGLTGASSQRDESDRYGEGSLSDKKEPKNNINIFR